MISREYLERLELTEDQITLLMDAQSKENKYRRLLESEHVLHIEAIMRVTDLEKMDLSNEDLIREKIRIEYEDMIPRQYRKSPGVQI